jgi:quercetin dioxygenase-like cupin family protein
MKLVDRSILIVALLLPAAANLSSQSTTIPNTPQRTPQFENEEVAVWKTVVPPNAPLKMHTHEHARVIVALKGGTMKVAYEDGTSEVHKWETGKAYWLSTREGLKRHADVNTGAEPIEVMVVELKKAN